MDSLHHGPGWNPRPEFEADVEHIVRWTISTRNLYDERLPAVAAAYPDLPIVRLRSRREVDRWLREIVEPLA